MNLKYVFMYGAISTLFIIHIFMKTSLSFQDSSSEISWAEQLIIIAEIIAIVAIYEMIIFIISVLIGYHEAVNPSMGLSSLFTNVFLGSLLFKLAILIVVSLIIMSTFEDDGDGNNADVNELVDDDMEYVFVILSECLFNAILASTISLIFPSKFGNQVDNKKINTTPEQRVLQRHKNIRRLPSLRINTDYDLKDNSEDIELYAKQMAELGYDEETARKQAKQFYNSKK
jgi:hypothetical protein